MTLTALLPDESERLLALDPCRSFIVQAPAGSGKTELLIRRFLVLLATVEHPEEILAITFTRKAAAEMRARVLGALEKAASPSAEGALSGALRELAEKALCNDRDRGWNLLGNPGRLQVQTIDSFCATLARRMPWISRMGAAANVSDDPAALCRAAAEQLLSRYDARDETGERLRLLLGHLDNHMELLCDLLASMLSRRDQWLRHVVGRGERSLFEESLASFVRDSLAALRDAFDATILEEIVRLGAFAGRNLADEGEEGGIALLAGLEEAPEADPRDLALWKGIADLLLTKEGGWRKSVTKNQGFPAGKDSLLKEKKEGILELLNHLRTDEGARLLLCSVRDLPEPLYGDAQWVVLDALTALLPRAVAELQLVFRREGEVDFIEVALSADRALGEPDDPTELLLQFDARISHILVDEFQDTSFGQFRLIEKLTAGWTLGDGRTLFLVGDPMQSIYRFREAEVGLFLKSRRDGIGGLPLTPLTLSANFRSQAQLISWINDAFPFTLPEEEDEGLGAVPFSPSHPVRDSLAGPAVTVTPFGGRDDAAEAAAVLDLVRSAAREHPEGTTAVLVRSRLHLAEIVRLFNEEKIRFRAQEIDPLRDRPVVRDLLALTRALLHPADRVAWLAVLRAPWCGLLLADLFALCVDVPDETIPRLLSDPARIASLSPDGRQRAIFARDVLDRARLSRGSVPLRVLVEGTWLALGGASCLEEGELPDAMAFLTLLDSVDFAGDVASFDRLDDALKTLFAGRDPEGGGLQVMTIHKAKGLEFDTVILPGLGRTTRGNNSSLLRWLEHPLHGLLIAPIPPRDGGDGDPIYKMIGSIEKEKLDLESARLFYVAATRAKRRLHLLGHAKPAEDAPPKPSAGSLLSKAWPVVEGDFAGIVKVETDPVEEEAAAAPPIRRVPSGFVPLALDEISWKGGDKSVSPSSFGRHEEGAVYTPSGEDGRVVGTVVHGLFERIALDGLAQWDDTRLAGEKERIARQLAKSGIPSARLDDAIAKVERAVGTTLKSERGRWILEKRGEAEVMVGGVSGSGTVHAVIDRTFVNDEGTRWIVDYKTSEPKDGDVEGFYAAEAGRYREQLESYTRLFRQLEETATIRAALYFPLFDGWCEISIDDVS